MFDDGAATTSSSSASVSAGTNPAATAAALTLVALNAAGVAASASSAAVPSTAVVPSTMAAPATLALQQQQQQQQLTQILTGKDPRWLQLEVCREFQRGQCSRSEQDCKYAHPPPHVEVQNGRVTACYDSIKGRCTRENPRCKYLHPPQHLKDQLLATGKQNLVMKNLVAQQLSQQQQTALPAMAQLVVSSSSRLSHNIPQQQPGAAPLALQSAALPLPYFAALPGLYPTAAFLPQVEPFSTLQATPPPPAMSASPATAAAAMQLALLQQQAQQPTQSILGAAQPNAAAALLLAQQQQAQQQSQQQQQLLLYLALQQQQAQQQQQLAAAMLAAQQQQGHHQLPAQQSPSSAKGEDTQTGRKRKAHVAGLEQQQPAEQELAALQQLAVAANANGSSGGYLSAKRPALEKGANGVVVSTSAIPSAVGGMPLYAATAQFNPYLVPAASFLPAVSFAGQLPQRFG